MRISHQAIYTWLAVDHRTGWAWSRYLRHHRRRRKGYGSGPRAPRISGRVSLADRPAIVARRGRVGDWEGDLMVGRGHARGSAQSLSPGGQGSAPGCRNGHRGYAETSVPAFTTGTTDAHRG